MPISISVLAANGTAVAFHRAAQLSVNLLSNTAMVMVNSYANEQAALDNLPIAWQWQIAIPVDSLAGDEPTLLGEVEVALIASAESPFAGGERVLDHSDTIDAARARAWASVKAARTAAEEGTFVFDGGVYQADVVRINGAVQLAVLAKARGTPFSETWTLEDNTTRTLDVDQVIALGLALGQYVSDVFAIGRALRDQINAATTIEEVQAIGWPA